MWPSYHGLAAAQTLGGGTLADHYADLIVYGATPGGIAAALEAARHGLSVVVVGGWREDRLGGMMSGGLGETDLYNPNAVGGIAREFFDRVNSIYYPSGGAYTYKFEPRIARSVFEVMVAEQSRIRVVYTTGISACQRFGGIVERIATRDGKSFAGRVFVDASYEGDLLAFAGVSYRIGREGVNEYGEPSAGVRRNMNGKHQFWGPEGAMNLSPFKTPGNPSSGYIKTIGPAPGNPGSADGATQAYNFRMCLSTNPAYRRPLMTSAPPGYDAERYEVVGRYLAELARLGLAYYPRINVGRHFLLLGSLPGVRSKFDGNAQGPVSTDAFGDNWAYPDAGFSASGSIDYALREQIWHLHRRHIEGLFWFFQGSGDSRVWNDLRDEFRQYWLANDEFDSPGYGDPAGWPSQLYVREARRMVGDFVLTETDTSRQEWQATPYADSVIGLASYSADSHHVRRWAMPASEAADGYRIMNEGDFFNESGGSNSMVPLPYSILTPRARECSNLLTPWSVSASHVAMGVTRMEPTHMVLGHACGMACVLMLDGIRQSASQDINVAELRAQLRAEGAALDDI